MNSLEREPVVTASIASGLATGGGLAVLQGPLTDILLEVGASERLSKAITTVLMVVIPVGVSYVSALWARRRTVTLATANNRIQMAAELSPSAPQRDVNNLMVTMNNETAPTPNSKEGNPV